jgi:hypothetical protein
LHLKEAAPFDSLRPDSRYADLLKRMACRNEARETAEVRV